MAKVKDYIPRLAEQTLLTKLNSSGCVIVACPKFCGKSTMCEEFDFLAHKRTRIVIREICHNFLFLG